MSSNSYPSPTPSTALLETAITIIILTLILLTWILRLTAPFPINYGEGPLLDQAVRLAHFKNIYQPIGDAPPWTVSNYPPLYQLLNVPFVWIIGPAFWYGRLISILATLSSAWLLHRIAIRLGSSISAARYGALMFLCSYPTLTWSSRMRVDALALALGLFAINHWLGTKPLGRRPLCVSTVLCLVALTRWINIVFPAVAIYLVLTKHLERRLIVISAILSIVLIAIAFGVLNSITDGWFWIHVVEANYNSWSIERVLLVFTRTAKLSLELVVIFISTIGSSFTARLRLPRSVYVLLAISSCTALSVGKIGSDVNYLLELCAMLGVCCAFLLDRFRWQLLRLIFAFSTALPSATCLSDILIRDFNNLSDPVLTHNYLSLLALIRENSGHVIADDMMGLEVLSGYPLLFQPFEMQRLAQHGKWDENDLVRAINAKKISLAIINADRTDNFLAERWLPPIRARLASQPHETIVLPLMVVDVYQFCNSSPSQCE